MGIGVWCGFGMWMHSGQRYVLMQSRFYPLSNPLANTASIPLPHTMHAIYITSNTMSLVTATHRSRSHLLQEPRIIISFIHRLPQHMHV